MKFLNTFLLVILTTAPLLAQKNLDLKNPEDALKATRKIQASMKDGENCIYFWTGAVYSRMAKNAINCCSLMAE